MEDGVVVHLKDLMRRTVEIKDLVAEVVIANASTPTDMNTRENLSHLATHAGAAVEAWEDKNIDRVLKSAGLVAWCGDQIGMAFEKSENPGLSSAGPLIRSKSADLRQIVDHGPGTLQAIGNVAYLFAQSPSGPRGHFDPIKESPTPPPISNLDTSVEELEASIVKMSERMADFRREMAELEHVSHNATEKSLGILSQGVTDFTALQEQVEQIAGHTSAKVIMGSYAESAEAEGKWANNLRLASLICMLVIGAVLIGTLIEASWRDLPWQQSIVRVVIAFLLSVPAAYLARESAKHREQQYHHLQTALDLKAVSPFVATLPPKQQNKIKATIAARLFAGRDFSKVSSDPYPINLQEIIVEALRAIDRKRSESGKKSGDKSKPKVEAGKKRKPKAKPAD